MQAVFPAVRSAPVLPPQAEIENHKRQLERRRGDDEPKRDARLKLCAKKHGADQKNRADGLHRAQHRLLVQPALADARAVRRLKKADRVRGRAIPPRIRAIFRPFAMQQLQKADPKRRRKRLERVDIRVAEPRFP